jgi:hypothetical protein
MRPGAAIVRNDDWDIPDNGEDRIPAFVTVILHDFKISRCYIRVFKSSDCLRIKSFQYQD